MYYYKQSPFYDENKNMMYHNIVNSEPDYNHPNISTEAKNIIKLLLMKDPKFRLNTAQAKNQAFFKLINFTSLLNKEVIPPFTPVTLLK